ncbi:hypothetical protein EQ500_01435 [Lactobacillus sp. XV13L]|nr:hypothetical protein [Lactobacillus sp. XV13L]
MNDPHQFFETHDDDDVLTCRWTMDRIERNDGPVWIMNHMFINPDADRDQVLRKEMHTVQLIARESHVPVWPLDPMVIDYFKIHPEFDRIWYHKPCGA